MKKRVLLLLLLLVLLLSVAVVWGTPPPRLVEAEFQRASVNVLFESTKTSSSYELAIVDVYADQPLFLNGTWSMVHTNHFMRLHRNHRQLLYGTFRLECHNNNVSFESFPRHGMSDDRAMLLFPLPSASNTEFRWLNAIGADHNAKAGRRAYDELNRISFAVLQSFRPYGHGSTSTYVPSDLQSCVVRFPAAASAGAEWPSQAHWANEQGVPLVGTVRVHERRDRAPLHFDLVEHDDAHEMSDVPTNFLEERVTSLPFLKMLMKPIMDGQLGAEVKGITDYLTNMLNTELPAKIAGCLSGSTTAGAIGCLKEVMAFVEVSSTQTPGPLPAVEPADPIDGQITKNLIEQLIIQLTPALTMGLTETLTAAVSEHLRDMVVMHLRDRLQYDITKGTADVTSDTLAQALGESIPIALARLLPPPLVMNTAFAVTHTVTRGLVHSLAPTLMMTMKYAAQLEPFCYYCKNGQTKYCHVCRRHESDTYYSSYYLHYYAAFFSDYNSDMWSGNPRHPGAEEFDGMEPGSTMTPPEHPSPMYSAT